MDWREHESLVHVIDRSIKIFPFCPWSIHIVLAIHYLEIFTELSLYFFGLILVWRIRINWLTSIPIIPEMNICKQIEKADDLLGLLLEEAVITDTI